MTLKLIAIVILALLGLSSVMNAKAFRVFLGGFAALCVLVFIGIVGMSGRNKVVARSQQPGVTQELASKLQSVFELEPNWRESAESTTNQILEDIELGRGSDERNPKSGVPLESETGVEQSRAKIDRQKPRPRVVAQRFPVTIKKDTEEKERASTAENLRAVVTSYLDWYKLHSDDVGVAQLQYENLNPGLLRFIEKRDEDGQKKFTVVFNDVFHRHVRLRGRQVEMKRRLESAAFAASVLGTLLFLAYGSLKVINARDRRRQDADYLQSSNISMV